MWNLIGPIGNVVVFTVILAQVMHARLPGVGDVWGYGIFLCSGIFTWGLFVEIVQRGAGMFIEHGNLLKKASFPKSSLPVIVVLSALVNFAIAFGALMVFLVVTGRFPGWVTLTAVPIIALLVVRVCNPTMPGCRISSSPPQTNMPSQIDCGLTP